MGRRGPTPTPTAALKARGSPLVTRERERSEVKGPEGKPRCPDYLDRNAKIAWRKLVPMLDAMGVLTRIDENALGRYCQLWSRWRDAEDFIAKHGVMYPLKDNDGSTKCFQQWPQVVIAHKLSLKLTRIEPTAGDCAFDEAAVQRAIDFFHECLTFTVGEWMERSFVFEGWQEAIVGDIFGWKRPDGRRRYREVFVFVPRKAGKTEMAGGLGNLLTFADGEPGAQVYCADREQASSVTRMFKGFKSRWMTPF